MKGIFIRLLGSFKNKSVTRLWITILIKLKTGLNRQSSKSEEDNLNNSNCISEQLIINYKK